MPPKKPGSTENQAGMSEEAGGKQRTPAAAKPAAKKAPTKKTTAKAGTAKAGTAAGTRAGAKRAAGPDLQGDLRQFVRDNPHGWGHDEWLGLLDQLRSRGHSVDDTEEIGRQLERERLATRLEGVQGVGPQRVKTISQHFGSIWGLMYADVDDLARSANIPRPLAERIKASV